MPKRKCVSTNLPPAPKRTRGNTNIAGDFTAEVTAQRERNRRFLDSLDIEKPAPKPRAVQQKPKKKKERWQDSPILRHLYAAREEAAKKDGKKSNTAEDDVSDSGFYTPSSAREDAQRWSRWLQRNRKSKSSIPPPPTPQKATTMEPEARFALAKRGADGLWSGERFGEVRGVPVGTVFGKGDYQREGRIQMAECGFFHAGLSQPEWMHRDDGCYAVILNIDNGLSIDRGDEIIYAGAGGRHRGQNRSAPQSFDQNWESATNKALRENQRSGRPIRIIRGPKWGPGGAWGTGKKGGGYRYDGLYTVTTAELQRTGPRKLLTAMFTLRKKKK